MKDLCITREQSIGIHDVANDQGFAMRYRAIFKHRQPFGSSPMWENQYSKAEGWIDLFSYVFLAKIIQYDLREGHNVTNDCCWSSTQRNVIATMATKPKVLVAKDKMLVALTIVSVTI